MGDSERDSLIVNRYGSISGNPESQSDSDYTPIYSSVSAGGNMIYKRRWYCLFLYTMLCLSYGLAVTLGNLAHAGELAFNWTNADVALLNMWPPVIFIFMSFFASWLLDTKGPRVAFLLAAGALAAGTGIRCIKTPYPHTSWCIHLGQIVLGFASPAVNSGSASFSSTWFPAHQRTLATAGAGVGFSVGIAVGAIIGPVMVTIPDPHNTSYIGNTTSPVSTTPEGVPDYVQEIRGNFQNLMYIEFGIALFIFIAMLIYFPTGPPTPPSRSASSGRTSFRRGMIAMFRKPNFCLLAVFCGITQGLVSSFGGQLDVDLYAARVPDDQGITGELTLGFIASSAISSIILSSLVDTYRSLVKSVLLLSVIVGFGSFLWFAFIIQGIAPPNIWAVFISYILGNTVLVAVAPITYELACDATYPVGEGLTIGAINFITNITSISFLLIFLIPNIGTLWMNWLLVGAVGLCIPLMIIFKPSNGRAQVDHLPTDKPVTDSAEDHRGAYTQIPDGEDGEENNSSGSYTYIPSV